MEDKYCPVCKKCSGCQLSNLSYTQQLRFKQNEVRVHFNRLCKTEPIIPAQSPLHYRNKAQLVFVRKKGRTLSGIYQSTSGSVVCTDFCALHSDNANRIARAVCTVMDRLSVLPYDTVRRTGIIKNVIIREGFATGETMVVLVCTNEHFEKLQKFVEMLCALCPGITCVVAANSRSEKLTTGGNARVLFGTGQIRDSLCGLDFSIGYNTFYQINPAQTEKLYNKAIELAGLSGDDTVLDAYCGIGTIGLIASRHCKQVIAVELNAEAVDAARLNSKQNGIDNIRFICADAGKYIIQMVRDRTPVSVAFTDPPRLGCSAAFLRSLASLSPRKIVYISCNIDTQLRDTRLLKKLGYKPAVCAPVDMFPYTRHIENIILFEREKIYG